MRRFLPVIGTLALLPALPLNAQAETCLDRVRGMAEAQGVLTDPPTVLPGQARRPGSPDDLARSGGVVEPPPVSDRSVIAPPRDHSGMPTLPDVKPKASPPAPSPQERGLDAADRSTLQALLVAARAEAERGDETGCLDGLRKAHDLLSRRRP